MRHIAAPAVVWCALTVAAFTAQAAEPELKTYRQKVSYAFGLDVGQSLKNFEYDFDVDAVTRGLADKLEKRAVLLTDEQFVAVMKRFREENAKRLKARALKDIENMKVFAAKDRDKKGVITTKSGLRYMILREGTGPKPKLTDRVRVHYRGLLTNGRPFDSSYGRGRPADFPLTNVIAGWTEVLQLMPVGSQFRVIIPPYLAYGKRGTRVVPPNAVLMFEIELLKILEPVPKKDEK